MTDEMKQEAEVQEQMETTLNKTPEQTTPTVDYEEFLRTKEALHRANEEAKNHRLKYKQAKEEADKWQGLEVDPEKVKTILAQEKQAEEERKRAEGRYEELLQETESKYTTELSTYQQRLQEMQSKVERTIVERDLAAALGEEGVNQRLAKPHIAPLLKAVEDESTGNYITVVIGEDGEPRQKEGGGFMTPKDLLQELKQDDEFAVLFPAPKVSGTASTGANTDTAAKSGTSPRKKRGSMSLEEKVAYREKYGVDAYNKLPF